MECNVNKLYPIDRGVEILFLRESGQAPVVTTTWPNADLTVVEYSVNSMYTFILNFFARVVSMQSNDRLHGIFKGTYISGIPLYISTRTRVRFKTCGRLLKELAGQVFL